MKIDELKIYLGLSEDAEIKDFIDALKEKKIKVKDWETDLKLEYEPSLHPIMKDKAKYPDKELKNEDGTHKGWEPITRVCIGLQKLATKRMSEFLFTIPVTTSAELSTLNGKDKDPVKKSQFDALIKILKKNKWDNLNKRRCKINLSECEQATYWYTVPAKDHNEYGFNSKVKIKNTVFSPANGDSLYPLFDDFMDMIAFSRGFIIEKNGKKVDYFETWTDEEYVQWCQPSGSNWEEASRVDITIGKIPIIYSYRSEPIWADGDNGKVEQIEKLLSKNGDIIDYHASPVLIIKGSLEGAPAKGESNKVFFTPDSNGGAEYLSWQQSPESIKFQFDSLLRLFWTELQLPDLSYDNVKGLGTTSGVALKLLFSDAHLKCGDEAETFINIIEREYNVLKAYLGEMKSEWRNTIADLEITPEIRPYIIDDEKEKIETLVTANGGKPVISQEQSVQLAALVEDPSSDYLSIKAEYLSESEQTRREYLFN